MSRTQAGGAESISRTACREVDRVTVVLGADSIQWIQIAGQVRLALQTGLVGEANDDEI